MENRYPINIAIVSGLIIVPAIIARLAGSSIHFLALLAVLQLICTSVFLLTSLVSIWRAASSLAKKQWKKAIMHAVCALLPPLTWYLIALVNSPGYEAAMSV